ncbi:cortactin-binding protein 2-like isoform X2 [Oscarella lobularis]|uniref:cortactin-binding protein 2-like isoform X2 n=1 Tax=Oscarella lobularis TaxID=121494 RepID=UPI00331341E2
MAFKNHKHFRVISPNPILGDWAATATSTPDANSPPRGEEEGHVDVQKMRAQIDFERAKASRFEREWNRLVRELDEERAASRRQAEAAAAERQRLEAKLIEETDRCRELTRSSPGVAATIEKRLELAEERCRGLERTLENRNPIGVHSHPTDFSQAVVRSAARGDADSLRQSIVADARVVSATERDGTTIVHAAARFGSSGCLAVLLDNGANASAVRPVDRATPLHLAASNGHCSCAELLLERNVVIDAIDKRGDTSLGVAAEGGRLDCVGLLLDRGAALGVVNKAGRNALHLATAGGHYRCLVRLVRAGERQALLKQLVGQTDEQGWTPIHIAANKGYDDCLSLLIGCSHGNLALQDNWGRTPHDLASTANCKELLNSRAHKPVVVKLRGQETCTCAGVARIQPHHQWIDFERSVHDVLTTYSSYVNGGFPSTADSSIMNRHPRMPSITIEEPGSSGASKTLHQSSQLGGGGERKISRESDSGHQTGSGSSNSSSRYDSIAKPDSGLGDDVDFDGGSSDGLGLSGDSVAFYEYGSLQWLPGSLPTMPSSQTSSAGSRLLGTPPPYLVFGGFLLRQEGSGVNLEVTVHLKGTADGRRLDDIVNDSLVSLSQLRSYTELLQSTQAVILCGPPGTEKSRLARLLGDSLRMTLKHDQEAEVTHIVLTPTFTRTDLLYLLHSKGFFVSADASSSRDPPSVLILDDMHRVPLPEVMAELLTALNYRGPQNAFWLSALGRPATSYAEQSSPPYKEGRYYLKKNAYFIGTMDKQGTSNMDVSIHHCFRWIMCQYDVEPIRGLLRRELRRRLLDVYSGRLPSPNDLLFRLIEWLWKTWRRLNVCAVRLQLPELSLGPRLFFSCPLVKDNPKAILKWFSDLWNFGIVPCVQDVVLRMNGSAATAAPDLSPDQAATPVLITLICKAIVPGCPLAESELKCFVEGLHGYSEGHQLLHDMRIKSVQVGDKAEKRMPLPTSKQPPPPPTAARKTPSPQRQRKAFPAQKESPSPRVLRRVATAPADAMPSVLQSLSEGGGGGGGGGEPARSDGPPAHLVTFRSATASPRRLEETQTMYVENSSFDEADVPINDVAMSKSDAVVAVGDDEAGNVRRGGSRAGDFARRLFSRLRGRSRPKGTPKLLRKEEAARFGESRSLTASPLIVKSRSAGAVVVSPSKSSNVNRSSSTTHAVALATTSTDYSPTKKSNSMPASNDSPMLHHSSRTSSSRVVAPPPSSPSQTHRTRSHSDASSRNRSKKSNVAESPESDDDRRKEASPPLRDGARRLHAVVTVADVHVPKEEAEQRRAMSRRRAQSFTSGSAAAAAANNAGQRSNRRRAEPTSDAPKRRPGPRLASQV